MTAMNKETARKVSAELQNVLQLMPKEFICKVGNGTYDTTAGTLTLKVTISIREMAEAPDAYTHTPEYRKLVDYARWNLIDLKPDMLTKVFDIPNLGKCKLVGYNSRSPKYPFVVARVEDGKKYRTSESSIKFAVRLSGLL